MRYKDHNLAPVGGWKFKYSIPKSKRFPDGIFFYENHQASGMGNFVRLVRTALIVNDIPVPDNLSEIVEDYICTYQPDSRCIYTKKTGDQISKVIHAAAGTFDKVFKTKLKPKAKGCPSCARRRNQLNRG